MTTMFSFAQPAARGRLSVSMRTLAALTLLLLVPTAARAAGLQVAPISLEFAAGSQAEALWLTNTGDAPIRAQVRVLRWTQVNGEESLTPSQDLRPSPAIVEIAPGQQQLVRIVRPVVEKAPQEIAYRLLIDELPGASSQPATGLQFLLRYSVPVFLSAANVRPDEARPVVSARVIGEGADAKLEVINRGTKRARLSELATVDGAGDRHMLVPGLLGYVLAGQQMQWPIALPPGASEGTFEARLNNDQTPQVLAPDRAGR
jgi:fimbrial chaperone protein